MDSKKNSRRIPVDPSDNLHWRGQSHMHGSWRWADWRWPQFPKRFQRSSPLFYRIGSHSIPKDYKEVQKGFQRDPKDLLRIPVGPKGCQWISLGFQKISQGIPMDSTKEKAKPNNINQQAVRARRPKTLGCSSRLAPSPSPRSTHPPTS